MIKGPVLAAFAAVSCCALFVAPAAAQQREPVSARVFTADLDLGHAAGRATLDRRLHGAIARACQSALAGTAGLSDSARCRREMRQDSVQKVAALIDTTPVRVAAR